MKANLTRWANPVLSQEATDSYMDIYGNDGENYIHVLKSSPYEIAVISRFLAYLANVKGVKE